MKKMFLAALLLLAVPAMVQAQNPYALFSAVCPSGQTLYYGVDPNGRGANVTWPNHENGDFWAGHTKPSGRVVIPDTVTWVYNDVTHVLPVYSVSQNCFNGCTGITTVVFPETIIAFEPNAFAGCSSLDSIFMPQVPPELFSGQPIGMSENGAFYIPCGTYQAYFDARYYTIHTGAGGVPCLEPEAEGVSLTLLADDPEHGFPQIVTHGVNNYVRCDSIAVIYAEESWHYRFDHWSNGSTKICDTLYVDHDMTLTAYYAPREYTVTLTVNYEERGTTSGSGTYTYLDTAELRAIANDGYHFLRWNDNNTDNPRLFVVEDDANFMAIFAEGAGIEDIDAGNVRVFANGNNIVVEGADGMRVDVFSVDGRRVNNGNLPKGVYLVKVGNLPVRKVVVTQ